MATQIWLIRHGETAWSRTGQHTGRTDIPLADDALEKTAKLRGLLAATTFAHVLTSPLQRAKRTCELSGLGGSAVVDPELMEWDYGRYEGKTSAQIVAMDPGWSIFRRGAPGGESPSDVSARADRVIARLHALDGRVAVFSHGHFLRALAARWVALPIESAAIFALTTAAVSILGQERDQPVIVLWNRDP